MTGAADGVAAAAALLSKAERPVIFAGNGVALSGAIEELAELARGTLRRRLPPRLMGKGLFPETDPLSVGTTGIWGTRAANDTTRDADVILAVGTRVRRSRLQLLASGIYVRDPRIEAGADRYRPG